uniref:POTRA domain-containing protein n=1 Tax=Rhizophora mucronata TaxID=61149 RepID=A0A2P2K774_RHIMU
MAKPEERTDPIEQNPNNDEDDIDQETEEEEDDDDDEELESQQRKPPAGIEQLKLENLFRRLQNEKVLLRVHDVIIKGNTKTKDSLLEAETVLLKDASSLQELLEASKVVNFRLQSLDIFDSVKITLDSGPPELPQTANVVVEVVESSSPISGEVGAYTKGEARSSTVEGSLKLKNIFGYGDLWDGSLAYGFDHMTEVSAGVYLPRFRQFVTPVTARVFLLSQDWEQFSSFKERSLGLSLGLFSTRNHNLFYNFAWRTMTDPSQVASKPVRRQLGHNLLSSLKYTFKIDCRNSSLRPVRGYAFVSTTHIGGLALDSRTLRFFRQEFDLRYAIPLGVYHSALNIGISSGVIFPWGHGFLDMPSPLPERFFLGGNISPICTLGGPTAIWGFNTRGIGPTEPRRQLRNPSSENANPGRDYLGGDLAVTAFADISFDFPLEWCRTKGIHGHIFASAGNVDKLTEKAYQNFSLSKFAKSVRSSVGVGIVVPTNLFRLEVNYCYMLKKFDHDHGKSGFRISFSTPS